MNINESNTPKLKRVSFICDASNLSRMEALMVKNDTNLSHLIRDAIEQYLSREGAEGK